MRPDFVVALEPVAGELLDIGDGLEQVGVEHLFAVATVEALDEGIVVGLAGLNEADLDLLGTAPLGKSLAGELQPVIAADGPELTVDLEELFQETNHAGCRKARRHVDSERSTIGLIDHVERAKRPSAVERVVHEIERPDRVDSVNHHH